MYGDRRARLLQEMAGEGVDVLLLYGNAWQNDYLRYATDFGILEGQALAIVREDGVTLYLDSALEADRAALECPGIEVVHAPDLLGERRQGAQPVEQPPHRHRAGAPHSAQARGPRQGPQSRRPHGVPRPPADGQARRPRSTPSAAPARSPTKAMRCS